MKIFCVIPVYNEEKTIREVVNNVRPLVDLVVIVNDGSTDKSSQLAEDNNIVVLHHLINRGQGAALKTGTLYALDKGADIIIHFDGDGQFLASDIKNITAPIKSGDADIVFGSRFLTKQSDIPLFKKSIILPLAKFVNRILLGIKMTDPQSGFRAMSAKVAGQLDWQQDRMAHCSEILYTTNKLNLKIKEVPITIIYHGFGQRFSDGFKILKDLLIARLIN
jgi:glycosyltransferase involved in cell wall biosynthesis